MISSEKLLSISRKVGYCSILAAIAIWIVVAERWMLDSANDLIAQSLTEPTDTLLGDVSSWLNSPLIGFIGGLMASATVQSSALVSMLLVELATVTTAISFVSVVMGVNVGTTLTCCLVALGLGVPRRGQARQVGRRALAAALIHVGFKLFTCVIVALLELFDILDKLVDRFSSAFYDVNSAPRISPVDLWLSAMSQHIRDAVGGSASTSCKLAFCGHVLGFALLFICLRYANFTPGTPKFLDRAIGRGWLVWVMIGLAATAILRASSTTTSIISALAGTRNISLKQACSLIIGANIGTTIVPFVFGTVAQSGVAGVKVALIHVFFNFLGACLFAARPLRERLLASAIYIASRTR
jgi:hypothetical protein